jgi:regulator of replication initiation timing
MNDKTSKAMEDKVMIARRIRLAAGIAAACLLGSGIAVAADEDAELKSPDPVTEKEVEDMRDEAAAEGSALPKESWFTGQSQPSDSDSASREAATPKQVEAMREQATALQKQADAMLEQAEVLRIQAEALRAQAEQGAAPLEQEDMVTDKEIKSLHERAEHREPMTKESWTSGQSTRQATEGEEDDDNSKNKDDE